MEIRSFHEPDSGTWTYLLADPDTGVTAVIDPVWVYDPVSGQTDRSFIDTVLETADVETIDPSDRLEALRWACWFCWFSLEGTIPVIIRDAT